MMEKKYILIGGKVEGHYISAHSLLNIYRLDYRECILVDADDHHKLLGLDTSKFTILHPRADGNYFRPTKTECKTCGVALAEQLDGKRSWLNEYPNEVYCADCFKNLPRGTNEVKLNTSSACAKQHKVTMEMLHDAAEKINEAAASQCGLKYVSRGDIFVITIHGAVTPLRQQQLNETGRFLLAETGIPVVIIPEGYQLEQLDEAEMAKHGWVKAKETPVVWNSKGDIPLELLEYAAKSQRRVIIQAPNTILSQPHKNSCEHGMSAYEPCIALFDDGEDYGYMLFNDDGQKLFHVQFCPFCGEKFPELPPKAKEIPVVRHLTAEEVRLNKQRQELAKTWFAKRSAGLAKVVEEYDATPQMMDEMRKAQQQESDAFWATMDKIRADDEAMAQIDAHEQPTVIIHSEE